MTLGQRIAQYRKALGLSQEALAELVGVSRQAVSTWELDEAQPDAVQIVLLAQALGVSTDQLLLGEDETETGPETGEGAAIPAQPRRDYPKALAGLLKKHGYKAGYRLIGYGALMLLAAGVMLLMVHGFFRAVDRTVDPWRDWEHGGSVEFQQASGVSLSPEEIDVIERELGRHGGDRHEY